MSAQTGTLPPSGSPDMKAEFDAAAKAAAAAVTAEGFLEAARKGDVPALQAMLVLKPDIVNATDAVGDTALIEAVRRKDGATAAVLLAAHADPDKANNILLPPIVLAVMEKDLKMVTLLLENKANPDGAADLDITALMAASEDGQEAIAAKLLEYKASTKLATSAGYTAATLAVINGHHGMVRLLKKHGADLDARDGDGGSLLDLVIKKRDDRMFDTLMELGVEYLLGNRLTTDPLKSNTTPVMWAAQADNTYALQKLKEKGAPLDTWNGHGMTPLIFSAIAGAGGTAKLLIDWDVPLDPPDPRRHSARRHAELKGHQHVVDIIDNAYGRRIGSAISGLQLGGGDGLDAPVKARFKKKGLAP